jgi:hypothetical protein
MRLSTVISVSKGTGKRGATPFIIVFHNFTGIQILERFKWVQCQ